MQNDITYQVFESILGELVELKSGAVCFQARVESVNLLRQNPGQERQPFSVELQSHESVNHGQKMYELGHPALGVHQLFLVPVGEGKSGTIYEIIFN